MKRKQHTQKDKNVWIIRRRTKTIPVKGGKMKQSKLDHFGGSKHHKIHGVFLFKNTWLPDLYTMVFSMFLWVSLGFKPEIRTRRNFPNRFGSSKETKSRNGNCKIVYLCLSTLACLCMYFYIYIYILYIYIYFYKYIHTQLYTCTPNGANSFSPLDSRLCPFESRADFVGSQQRTGIGGWVALPVGNEGSFISNLYCLLYWGWNFPKIP